MGMLAIAWGVNPVCWCVFAFSEIMYASCAFVQSMARQNTLPINVLRLPFNVATKLDLSAPGPMCAITALVFGNVRTKVPSVVYCSIASVKRGASYSSSLLLPDDTGNPWMKVANAVHVFSCLVLCGLKKKS